jgi:hypothetical protein
MLSWSADFGFVLIVVIMDMTKLICSFRYYANNLKNTSFLVQLVAALMLKVWTPETTCLNTAFKQPSPPPPPRPFDVRVPDASKINLI